jgi:hypothetical protein
MGETVRATPAAAGDGPRRRLDQLSSSIASENTESARANQDVAQQPELREAWRAVANSKLTEFRRQCWRLAHLVRQGLLDKNAAIDALHTIAIAHALVRALGEDRVQAILNEAFADSDFHPLRTEVA